MIINYDDVVNFLKHNWRTNHPFTNKNILKYFSDISSTLLTAVSIDINQIVYNMKRAGKKIITLSLGEAFFKIPQYDFESLNFEKGYHYSDTSGIPELRKKIANYYQNKYDAPVFPSEIVVSAGSKALIFMTMKAILNNLENYC